MEKGEQPSLDPEWLRTSGNASGGGGSNHLLVSSSSHSDSSSIPHNSRNRNSRSKSDVDSVRSPYLDRSSSTNSMRGSSNGSAKLAYSSFNFNSSQRDNDPSLGAEENCFQRTGSDKDFPSLGAEEKHGGQDVVRVSSPGLSSAVQSLPIGNSALIGGEGWTSALAEVPNVIEKTCAGSLNSPQANAVSTGTLTEPTGLNMAEALVSAPARTNTPPQGSVKTQRLEDLRTISSRLSGEHGTHRNAESSIGTAHADSEEKNDEKGHRLRERRVKRRRNRSSSRSMTISQCLGVIDRTAVDIELGIVDALEVATKVAQEVAREVDSGEPSLSSSEEVSVESGQSALQDSCGADLCTSSPSKGLSVGENHSFEEEPHGEHDEVMDVKNDKPGNGIVSSDDVEKPQLGATSKSEMGREKSPCDFDLNQDIYSDETDLIVPSISATTTAAVTPIMPVSHAVSASGMPAALWQLERTRSLKGTAAATSAFHEVSPPNVPSGNLREKQVICRGIDLNVAEVGEDQFEDLAPWKQICFSSSHSRGGESSQEANPRGSSRFNLDLNCPNEDGVMPPPSQSRMETRLFLNNNGQPSSSPASSVSSALSGKEVNFDLNDRPEFFIDSHNHSSYYGQHPWITAPYGGHKLDGPVISILGTKVDVNRKESVSQMTSFFSNGKSLEPTAGIYMARRANPNPLGLTPGVSFSPTPIYGYNGITVPPGLSVSSPMLHVPGTAIPYMDSRGSPVMMPQIIGSTPTPYMQTTFPQQHLVMNLGGGSSVQPNIDECCGFGVEVGNRESIGLRQFLSPGQSGVMGEEHSGTNVGGKRKETETRWEFPPWR